MPSLRSRSCCRPKVTSFSIEYEAPPSRTNALLRKVNSTVPRSPAALLCQNVVGRLLKIDYSAAAEVYYMPVRRRGGKRQRLAYRRFATAAEAIRFVVEDFPAAHTLSPWMQVGDNRFDGDAIRRFYDSSDYPLGHRSKRQPKRSRGV